MFPVKKIEGDECQRACYVFFPNDCSSHCFCNIQDPFGYWGVCTELPSMKKMVEENPNLCHSDTECRNKGSGNYCARFPNSDLKYGWCFASIAEAEDAFKMASSYKFNKDFLKMSLPA